MEPLKPKKPTASKKPATSKTSSQQPARRTVPEAPAASLSEDLHPRIETRAREIYEQRTSQGALDDWLQAEREILTQERAKPKTL